METRWQKRGSEHLSDARARSKPDAHVQNGSTEQSQKQQTLLCPPCTSATTRSTTEGQQPFPRRSTDTSNLIPPSTTSPHTTWARSSKSASPVAPPGLRAPTEGRPISQQKLHEGNNQVAHLGPRGSSTSTELAHTTSPQPHAANAPQQPCVPRLSLLMHGDFSNIPFDPALRLCLDVPSENRTERISFVASKHRPGQEFFPRWLFPGGSEGCVAKKHIAHWDQLAMVEQLGAPILQRLPKATRTGRCSLRLTSLSPSMILPPNLNAARNSPQSEPSAVPGVGEGKLLGFVCLFLKCFSATWLL